MRLRKKWWARPEMEKSNIFVTEPNNYKGKWKEVFNNDNEIHLELGCGRGQFIINKAIQNPNINYIAIDLKDEVLIYVVKKAEEKALKNIRVIALNIQNIEGLFDEGEISQIYINFCNPWPKERHKKRRLTHKVFLERYKKFVKPNSEVWFKTDDTELFDESIDYFKESGFKIMYLTYDLHKWGFSENTMTEYEEKFTSCGLKIMFLIAKLN